jgi:hypothetical protein
MTEIHLSEQICFSEELIEVLAISLASLHSYLQVLKD